MSYTLFKFTPECQSVPTEWSNFVDHCSATVEGWDNMTSRQSEKAVAKALQEYNGWTSDDVMDAHGIWPTHWSLHFETEKDATAFVLKWS